MNFIRKHPFITAFICYFILGIVCGILNSKFYIPVIEDEIERGLFTILGLGLTHVAFAIAALFALRNAKRRNASKLKIIWLWIVMIYMIAMTLIIIL